MQVTEKLKGFVPIIKAVANELADVPKFVMAAPVTPGNPDEVLETLVDTAPDQAPFLNLCSHVLCFFHVNIECGVTYSLTYVSLCGPTGNSRLPQLGGNPGFQFVWSASHANLQFLY
jgi:hypothetical protein